MQRSVGGFSEIDGAIRIDVQPVDAAGEPAGAAHTVTARYLVGCDGGRSPVRTALGLPFDGKSESTKWLVIDIADEPIGTPNVHFVLDDEFPHVVLALPHGVLRYEFMVPGGRRRSGVRERRQRAAPARTRAAAAGEAERDPPPRLHAPRAHRADLPQGPRAARRRRRAPDAGLAGPGLQHRHPRRIQPGVEARACRQRPAGDALLDTYTQERHAHAGAMIDLSVLVGKIFVPSNPLLRVLRNVVGPWLSKLPSLRQYIAEMRFKPMPFFSEGAVVHRGAPDAKGLVGKVFMQPRVADASGKPQRLDDAIGLRFALLTGARAPTPGSTPTRAASSSGWMRCRSSCAPTARRSTANRRKAASCLADIDGAFKRWFDEAPGGVVILRPDRIVAAVCKPWELSDTLRALADACTSNARSEARDAATERCRVEGGRMTAARAFLGMSHSPLMGLNPIAPDGRARAAVGHRQRRVSRCRLSPRAGRADRRPTTTTASSTS